jgi:hypothetical protein
MAAKRRSAAGKRQKSHSHKTAKRLAIKKAMLEAKSKKKKQIRQGAKKKK